MKSRVSVVIPCFNDGEFPYEAVASVQNAGATTSSLLRGTKVSPTSAHAAKWGKCAWTNQLSRAFAR